MGLAVKKADTNAENADQEFWLVALTDIATGDEVNVSYLSVGELKSNVHVRRTKLKTTWGVECMCSKCASDIAKAESNSQATARVATQRQETVDVRNRAETKRRADNAGKQRIHNRYH